MYGEYVYGMVRSKVGIACASVSDLGSFALYVGLYVRGACACACVCAYVDDRACSYVRVWTYIPTVTIACTKEGIPTYDSLTCAMRTRTIVVFYQDRVCV